MTAGNKLLRFGVVGAGRMGSIHIENLLSIRYAEVTAVCTVIDREKQWVKETVPGAQIYDSFDKFIEDPSIDAVIICSPSYFHEEQFLKCLQKNKHIFCEKPLSPDAKVSWDLYRESLKHPNLKVACGFSRRFVEPYQHARKAIAEGKIGDVIAVQCQTTDQYNPSPEFANYIKTSGGIFVDCNIHDVDVALYLIGEDVTPNTVYATGTSRVYPQFAEWGDVDNSHGIITFKEGIVVNIHGSRDNPHGHHTWTEIFGTKGRILVNKDPRGVAVDYIDSTGTRMVPASSQMELWADSYKVEISTFRDWILFGKEDHGFNLKDAAKSVTLGHLLQESVRSGKLIPVPAEQ
uniref:ARAD1D18590p n=1 Tax=Blastobotrys adeninivorans TaxID=409370 RepID=A0A060TF01_BLAAD